MTIDDPITILKQHQRQALDQQAELATEARQLAGRVQEVTAELATLKRHIDAYNAILTLITQATRRTPETPAEPKSPTRRQTR